MMKTPDELNEFVDACIQLVPTADHEKCARLLRELIGDHESFAASVPAFSDVEASPLGWTLGGEHICHQTDELTVMILDTLPGVLQPPHDHAMNAIIGVFEGREDQRFWARSADGVAPAAGRSLEAGEVMVLGERAIHAISSPVGQAARAIHVYFGDIYAVERSVFDPESLEEHRYTSDHYDQFCQPLADS